MRTASFLASSALVMGCVTASCGGHTESELFGAPASSSSGDSGTSGGTSGSPTDAATSGGCRLSKDDCKSDEYCQAASCVATEGVCTKKPTTESGMYTPVCGCDQITYWNKELAASRGVNIATAAACPASGALACSEQARCPGEAKCNLDRGAKIGCTVAAAKGGKCWGVPSTCPPPSSAATRVKACSNDACTPLCQAIVDQVPSYTQGVSCN